MMRQVICQQCTKFFKAFKADLKIISQEKFHCKSEASSALSTVNHRKMSDSQKEDRFVKEREIGKGKWISLKEITYKDHHGKERTWEAAGRTTTQKGSDGVCVIAILKRMLKYDCLILVKQYRPPLKSFTLEFVAGLIDPDETPSVCGIRELKEETGYTGVAKHHSPATCLDPGFASATCHLVTAEIDGDLDCNIHPKPILEEYESIDVICVPMDELLERLNNYTKEGLIVNSMVYSYAVAMEQTKNFRNKSSI